MAKQPTPAEPQESPTEPTPTSLDAAFCNDPIEDGDGDSKDAITALVHRLRGTQIENTGFVLKHPRGLV
jgi:hypothetical protein